MTDLKVSELNDLTILATDDEIPVLDTSASELKKMAGLQGIQFAADAEASDAYAVTLDPVPAAYFTGMLVAFTANTANTGAATLNVNSLGAKTIKKKYDQDLNTGDIESGQMVVVQYDETNFQMVSQVAGFVNTEQPAFLARITSSVDNVTGDGTTYSLAAAIWTEIYDQGADFSNGTFSAPATGKYHFDFILGFSGISANHDSCQIYLIASNRTVTLYAGSPYVDRGGLTYVTKTMSYDIDMDLGDTFYISFKVGDTDLYIDIGVNTIMSGHLIA